MKIKRELDLLKDRMKKPYQKYPVTIILTILLTIILSVSDDYIKIEKVILFLLLLVMSSFFSEVFFTKLKSRIISLLLFIPITFLIEYFILETNKLGLKISVPYIIIINLLSFYKLYKKSKKNISEYFLSITTNIFKTTIFYYILSMGFLFIGIIFASLILEGDNYDIIFRIEILLFGIFFFPNLLEDISNTDSPKYEFIKVIFHYILESIIMICFLIIYIYIIKIIVTLTLPSNSLFRILSVLFIISFPIWIINDYYQKDFLSKINHYLKIAFIPFIFLEIYTLGIRIIYYGITYTRYIGIMMIIF